MLNQARPIYPAETLLTPERWQQIKQVLDDAELVLPSQRKLFLERACGDDSDLLREVAKLLDVESELGDFIDEPLWSLGTSEDIPEASESSGALGRRIGPYRLDRVLGKGGMGTVFLATREDDYEQRVALKIVSWHLDSEQILARFVAERQILANLHHPSIVQLLDGGTTPDGRPYLVMEYVEDAEPIDDFCERHNLSIEDRLRLFCQVCEVVHFAHQNLVIHRDLKPSNILVTPDGAPRLLDFGIAKLIGDSPYQFDLTTEAGPVPMTPSCASPEQFMDEPITTACDVYALGLLLYRLVAKRPAYDFESQSLPQIMQMICWQEPEKPSLAVLSPIAERPEDVPTLAGAVETAPPPSRIQNVDLKAAERLSRRLAGDLDAIVLKALRKDAQHRYGSTAEMADDIERHLLELPVRAHQGNWLYHWGKFFRRNRLRLVTAAFILALVLGLTAALAIQFERTVHLRSRAETLNTFLNHVFLNAMPNRTHGETVTARDMLDRGREMLGDGLQNEPTIQAEFLGNLGRIYRHLGQFDEARALYEEALAISRRLYPNDHEELARVFNDLAALAHDEGLYEESESYYREALGMRRRLHGQTHRDVARSMNGLGSTLSQQGRYEEARAVFEESLEIRRSLYEPRHPQIASGLNTLGTLFFSQGHFTQAETQFREALEIRLEARGANHTETATSQNNLARVLFTQGQFEPAEALYRQALETRRLLLGENNTHVAITKRNLALLLLEQEHHSQALKLASEAVDTLRQNQAPGDWQTAEAESVLGLCLSRMGRYEEADAYLTQSFERLHLALGESSSYTIEARERLREHYEVSGQSEKLARPPKLAPTV